MTRWDWLLLIGTAPFGIMLMLWIVGGTIDARTDYLVKQDRTMRQGQ